MKVVINQCYGGFSLSQAALAALEKKGYVNVTATFEGRTVGRRDPRLIEVVEELGADANGTTAKMVVVDLPDSITDWRIREEDGYECVDYVLDGKIHST